MHLHVATGNQPPWKSSTNYQTEFAPRVNGKHLGRYQGRIVCMIVQCEAANQSGGIIGVTPDNMRVNIQLPYGETSEIGYVNDAL